MSIRADCWKSTQSCVSAVYEMKPLVQLFIQFVVTVHYYMTEEMYMHVHFNIFISVQFFAMYFILQ